VVIKYGGLKLVDERINLLKLFASISANQIQLISHFGFPEHWLMDLNTRSASLIAQGKIEAMCMMNQPFRDPSGRDLSGKETVVLVKINIELGKKWVEKKKMPRTLAEMWWGWRSDIYDDFEVYYTSEDWKERYNGSVPRKSISINKRFTEHYLPYSAPVV
jgi:hypothetical protein